MRLAQAQGLLNNPSLNPIQAWALGYWIAMDRRVYLDDKHEELKQQTYNLFPERWGDLYREETLPGVGMTTSAGDIGTAFGSEPEMVVTNLDDYDKFYASLNQSRGITGEQAMRYSADPLASVLGVPEGERFWSVND